MPVNDDLYVLAPGEGDEGGDDWVSPRPIDDGVAAAVAAETDLDFDDVDDLEGYVDPEEVAAVVESDGDETVTFTVEGHDVVVDASGHVRVDAD
jgi:hypothetical protein